MGKEFLHIQAAYSREMANWLQERLIPSIVDCSSIIRATTKEFSRLKQVCLLFRRVSFIHTCRWILCVIGIINQRKHLLK